jgi:hypothetical protein
MVAGTKSGRVELLRLVLGAHAPLSLLGPPITTAVRLWLHCAYLKGGGRWDAALTAVCAACGGRLSVPTHILDTITAITSAARLEIAASPFATFPAEAWADPRLLSECPLCHEPLRFNPFVVDNKPKNRW